MCNRAYRDLPALILSVLFTGVYADPAVAQSQKPAAKPTPARLLVHYLPWYEAKPRSPAWGWHWTMNVFDPDGSKAGRPTIASHYHPLIGPYDSGDPDVLEYHALLMRLAGIDGVIFDWYGTVDLLDYAVVHRNASAFVDQAAKAGLSFAVCYEDQTIPKLAERGLLVQGDRVAHAGHEIEWLRAHWFGKPEYLQLDGRPVLLSFGRDGLTDNEWQQVLGAAEGAPLYLSEHERRPAAAGAFDWPKPREGLKAQREFFKSARKWKTAMPVAFPRFHDIYEQAKLHPSWGRIDDDNGKTFATTLDDAIGSQLPLIQICTWNDWGEGTIIEPSVEFGYRDLERLQLDRRKHLDPGFPCRADDLRLPHRLYELRKQFHKGTTAADQLDAAARSLAQLSASRAREMLDAVAAGTSRFSPK
jgi:hypothetical protein